MSSTWNPTPKDFENPTPELITWLKESLAYYERKAKIETNVKDKRSTEEAIAVFRSLLEEAEQKANIYIRSLSPSEYPEVCTLECPFHECPWYGKQIDAPCRQKPAPTTEQLKKQSIIYRNISPRKEGVISMLEEALPKQEEPSKPDLPTLMPKEYEDFVRDVKAEIAAAEMTAPLEKALKVLDVLSDQPAAPSKPKGFKESLEPNVQEREP